MSNVIYNLEGKIIRGVFVIKRLDKINHRSRWLVRCECGVEFEVYQSTLLKKRKELNQLHCKKCSYNIIGNKNFKDLTGKKFGSWTVLERVSKIGERTKYLCKCDCGSENFVIGSSLTNGQSAKCRKCGYKYANYGTHNKYKTRLYTIWVNIKSRCNRETATGFQYYGGKGIKICEEWSTNFINFYNWSMNNGYSDDLTIDRIDVNGNYEPSNCRWVSKKEQANNKTTNHYITYNGETKTISQWSSITGISQNVILQRLERYKWSVERALTEPLNIKYAHNKGGADGKGSARNPDDRS